MDKIFSARMDEAVIQRIGSLARRLRTSKKRVVENAVAEYAAKLDEREGTDVFEQTSGAWKRKEPAPRLMEKVRGEFRKAMTRHRS